MSWSEEKSLLTTMCGSGEMLGFPPHASGGKVWGKQRKEADKQTAKNYLVFLGEMLA